MALLLELADYYLRGLKKVPEEKACTCVARCKHKIWRLPIRFPHFFHLQPIEDSFDILSNIKSSASGSACNLPFEFLKVENVVVPMLSFCTAASD